MSTHTLEHNNGQLAYEDTGHGPLVVCLPSMGDLRAEYRFLTPQLVAAGYRVVTLDVRGHGASSTAWADYSVGAIGSDLVTLVQQLAAGPALVIGTSMAAGAAVWAAAEAPQLFSGLVLIGPFVRGGGGWLGKLLYGALFSRPWGPAVWGWYYATLYPTRKPADFVQYRATLQANLQEPGRMEALQQMLYASKAASAARLSQVRTSVLVLMGSKDPDFKAPQAEAQWVADQLHGRYTLIAGAGHYPHAELPEVTGPLVLAFLRSITPAQELAHVA
jgi:pimeloyl-ACP methyl ester carboxylesterase